MRIAVEQTGHRRGRFAGLIRQGSRDPQRGFGDGDQLGRLVLRFEFDGAERRVRDLQHSRRSLIVDPDGKILVLLAAK